MFGAFMAVMDISVVNVALPHMMGTFGSDLSSITWVATSYSIAEIILVSLAGWLAMLIGRKRLYLLSFALFTVGSVLCGTATTFNQILIYRAIQGIGGGALIPVSQAILRETFPPKEQGMAMAIFGMGVVLAPAAGPIIGGWLTDHYGWPWIFFINVPVSLVGMLLIGIFVHDPSYLKRGVKSVDWLGLALLTLSLTSMQLVLERGQEENWFDSNLILAGSVICVLATVWFIFWELNSNEPIVDFRLLKNRQLSVGSTMGFIFGIGLFGSTFILPQFTQQLLGYPALEAGLVLLPRALTLLLCMHIVGWLYKHSDARWTILFGIGAIVWSYYDLARLSLEADFWSIVPMLALMGVGMAFMFVTVTTVALSTTSRRDMTSASALYTLSRRVGGNLGYAIVATLIARGQQLHRSTMVGHISPLNPNYVNFSEHANRVLTQAGVPSAAIPKAQHLVTEKLIMKQSTMLAYNDVSFVLGLLFFLMVPLLFLLPRQPKG
ncbi:MAG: MFS transporter [Deltaproteobacteria bacterium]|nr:MAG: MFS transporter [Deltaproteobacteria bacterium]